jgi:SAM-dependent methyltransferase
MLRHRSAFKIAVLFGCSLLVCALIVVFAKAEFGLEEARGPKLDAGFITTSPSVVTEMLRLADVNEKDIVYDLGCGDGRIVITAARDFGARGVGIDLNPKRVVESMTNAKLAGVDHLVRFEQGNFFEVDFSEATVVALYLPARLNIMLRPILWKQLKVGSRVVSNDSTMGPEWPPEKTSAAGDDGVFKPIYMWTVTEEQKKAVANMTMPTSAVHKGI